MFQHPASRAPEVTGTVLWAKSTCETLKGRGPSGKALALKARCVRKVRMPVSISWGSGMGLVCEEHQGEKKQQTNQ